MEMSISFIHTADLHLGRVFTGLRDLPESIYERVVESGFYALEKLISAAIDHDVDFVLFVGDIFDSNVVSLRTYLRFQKQLERLKRHHIHALISYGNHDPLEDQPRMIRWPDNVTEFSNESVVRKAITAKSGEVVHIYGFSYMKKKVVKNKSGEYSKSGDANYHIAMLHGNVEGQTEHDPYAPFSIQQLLEKEFDYWALGHIHKHQVLASNPPIVYPGNIQGMHRKELGEKGCMLVTLSNEKQAELTFIPTAHIIWREEEIDITNVDSLDTLFVRIAQRKEQLRKKPTFVHLRFVGSGMIHEHLQSRNQLEDLLWAINEHESGEKTFVWIVDVSVHTTSEWKREELRNRPDFLGELIQTIDTYDEFDKALQPLFKNRFARAFINAFNEEEKQAILENAERILLTQFMKEQDK